MECKNRIVVDKTEDKENSHKKKKLVRLKALLRNGQLVVSKIELGTFKSLLFSLILYLTYFDQLTGSKLLVENPR